MACKRACREPHKFKRYFQWDQILRLLASSHASRSRTTGRRPRLRRRVSETISDRCSWIYADISMSLDGAWGDLTSACAEGPSVAFDHLRWEAPQRAISRGGLGMSPIDTTPIERSVR